MSNLIVPDKNDIVRKSDFLVKARYKLNPLALKFITLVIANVKKSDINNKRYIFKIKDFMELTGKNYKEIYNELDEATEELLKSPIKIPQEDGGFLKLNWVSSAKYHKGEGIISFKIDSDLRPYIFDLQERFLKYRIENILRLRSGYVIRLYEILKDWFNQMNRYHNSKKVEKIVEIKWLRETLEVPNSYQYSSHIKQRIIEKAQKDLKQYTDLQFSYEEIKTGRKVTHIKFIIEPNLKNSEQNRDFYFLKSKLRFIAYIRKNYKHKTFYILKFNEPEEEVKYFIGDDSLVWINDGYEIKKLPSTEIDTFFGNVLQAAKSSQQYATALSNKEEIAFAQNIT